MTKQALFAKIDTLPDETIKQLEMFVDFLLYQKDACHIRTTLHSAQTSPQSTIGFKHENDQVHELPLIDVNEALKDYKSPFPELNDPAVLDKPMPGIAKGKFWMADDFDEPLEEMMEYMY